jgi:hypothetical protein
VTWEDREVGLPIQVVFVPFRGRPVRGRLSPLAWKRRMLWDCPERNEVVRLWAEQLAATPRAWLRRHGLAALLGALPRDRRPRVTILVEGAEHARRLASLLPLWHRCDLSSAGSPAGPAEIGLGAASNGVITTIMHAYRFGFAADILVRATGHRGRLGFGAQGAGGNSAAGPTLLIDIADETDARGRADTEARRREYGEQGLSVLTTVTP